MTDAERDAAWRSLPEYFKFEVRQDYTIALEAKEQDPNNERIYAHIIFLERYFGKHNLTATEEEKPRFKVGDLVLVKKEFDFGSNFGLAYVFGVMPHPIKEIADGKAFLQNDWDGSHDSEYAVVPLDYLIPYTKEQEPEEDEGLADMIERGAKMAKDSLRTMINDEVDWLAYRMDLAKAIAVELIRSERDTTFLAESTSLIVDGIVRRLKEGDK